MALTQKIGAYKPIPIWAKTNAICSCKENVETDSVARKNRNNITNANVRPN